MQRTPWPGGRAMIGTALRHHRPRLVRFAVVGAVNSLLDLAIFSLLFYGAGAPLLLANALGYLVGLANSFALNSRWTFPDSSRRDAPRRAALFASLNLVGLLIASLVIWLLALVVPAMLAKLGAIGAAFVWNYWSSHRLVFRS